MFERASLDRSSERKKTPPETIDFPDMMRISLKSLLWDEIRTFNFNAAAAYEHVDTLIITPVRRSYAMAKIVLFMCDEREEKFFFGVFSSCPSSDRAARTEGEKASAQSHWTLTIKMKLEVLALQYSELMTEVFKCDVTHGFFIETKRHSRRESERSAKTETESMLWCMCFIKKINSCQMMFPASGRRAEPSSECFHSILVNVDELFSSSSLLCFEKRRETSQLSLNISFWHWTDWGSGRSISSQKNSAHTSKV